MIMFAHSAASLMPFMQQTWAEETDYSDACLLKHWGISALKSRRNMFSDQVEYVIWSSTEIVMNNNKASLSRLAL